MNRFLIIFMLFAPCFIFNTYGNRINYSQITLISNSQIEYDLSDKLFIFNDSGLSIPSTFRKNNFKFISNKIPNFGITNKLQILKYKIINQTLNDSLILKISNPSIDTLFLFVQNQERILNSYYGGEHLTFNYRIYEEPNYIYKIYCPKNQIIDIILFASSKDPLHIPISIASEVKMMNTIFTKNAWSGIYFGIMLAMLLYNLFLYFSIFDKTYLVYCIYLFLTILTQTSLQGYPFMYFYPNYPNISELSLFIFPALTSLAGLEFARSYFNLKSLSPTLNWISTFLYLPFSLSLIFVFLKSYSISYSVMEIGSTLVSIHLIVIPIVGIWKNYKPSWYFLIAWITFLIGVFIFIFKDFGIVPYNDATRYTMTIGTTIETIILSLALANRINILKKEKDLAQLNIINVLKEKESIITNQNTILESKVLTRTIELEISNKQLKEAEEILVQSEKMASLGRMVAGISHEINNPINFITSNINPLKRDINDLLAVINDIQKESLNMDPTFKNLINSKLNEIDLHYLNSEISELLQGIEEGAFRTADTVKSLKSFSRSDLIDEKTKYDISLGVNSALIIHNNEIKSHNIIIVNAFTESIFIHCFPIKINQIFMNLINNAIYAVINNGKSDKTICINYSKLNGNIEIEITDNGNGIPNEITDKIWEPFFTTKEVGQGTGMGLSIVYGNIMKHNGSINAKSENGRTSFQITLPL